MLFHNLALLHGIVVLDPEDLGIRRSLAFPSSKQLQELPITRIGNGIEDSLYEIRCRNCVFVAFPYYLIRSSGEVRQDRHAVPLLSAVVPSGAYGGHWLPVLSVVAPSGVH